MALIPVGQRWKMIEGVFRPVNLYYDEDSDRTIEQPADERGAPGEGEQALLARDETFPRQGPPPKAVVPADVQQAPVNSVLPGYSPTPNLGSLTQQGPTPSVISNVPVLGGGGQPSWGAMNGDMSSMGRYNEYIGGVGVQPGYQNAGTPGASGVTGQQDLVSQNMGRPGANVNTAGLQGQTPDPEFMRGNLLFSPDNPVAALNNVLRGMNINPFNAGNPFVQFIQRAAPGLAAAYYMQNALQPGVTGETVANNPMGFQQFLQGSIGGGNVFSGLAGQASRIPDIINAIRGIGEGTDVTQVNPFLHALNQMLGRNFGEGSVDVLSALLGPAMPRSLGQAYRSGLEAALSTAQYNFPFEDKERDIWEFLFR
jgi:hypothetical protein